MSIESAQKPQATSTMIMRRRLLAVMVLLAAGGVFAYVALSGVDKNLVYYWNSSELLAAKDQAQGAPVRLGGLVVDGSVKRGDDGLDLHFLVTDGKTTVPVHAHTLPPAMFRAGIGVLLEGEMGKDGVFESSRLMVKHDNEYRAPDYEDGRSVKELAKTLNFSDT